MEKLIAVFQNGLYKYGKINESNTYSCAKEFSTFPKISIKYLEQIKSFDIPNLGYNVIDNMIQIFDKTKETYIPYSLRVYIETSTGLKPTIKTIQVLFPSEDSYDEALKIYSIIEKSIQTS